MCRLVAYAGAPASLARFVLEGTHSLFRQSWAARELLSGSVNADGYGIAWWPDDRSDSAVPSRIARAEPIWYDPDLPRLLDPIRSPVVQAALRNATPGLPVDRAGLLPLVVDGWAFTLNGYVPAFRQRHMRALRRPLSDRRYADLKGVSDAETLFLRVLDDMDRGLRPTRALRNAAAAVAERLDDGEAAPLTMQLASPTAVHTLHTSAGGGPCNSLYLLRNPPQTPTGSILASEPFDDHPDWTPVPAPSEIVQRSDGSVTVRRTDHRPDGRLDPCLDP